jgi:hypothetical protein
LRPEGPKELTAGLSINSYLLVGSITRVPAVIPMGITVKSDS